MSDVELEAVVLLRAFEDQDWLAAEQLLESDFSRAEHRAILRAIRQADADAGVVDHVTVRTALGKQLRVCEPVLAKILGGHFSDADTNTERLRDMAECRRLAAAYEQGALLAARGSLQEARAHAAALDDVPQRGGRQVSTSGEEQACLIAEHMAAATTQGLHPGCHLVSGLVGELWPGMELVVGAATNVGKSSIALEMAEGMASRGVPTATLSFEDAPLLFAARRLARISGVPSKHILRRTLSERQGGELIKALPRLAEESLLRFAHLPGGTVSDAVLEMTRQVRTGARAVIVDYLQAISPATAAQDRRNEMREANTILKATAHRLGVPLVMVSQLRRRGEREASKPSKHDLKEAGDIENSADVIILAWREEERDDAEIRVWCAKSKYGGVGFEAAYRRDESGTLRVVAGEDDPWG